MGRSSALLLLLLALVASHGFGAEARLSSVGGWTTAFAGGGNDGEEARYFPGELQDVQTGSGGRISVWDRSFQQFQDVDIQAGIVTIEPQGLALPHYTDSDQVHYVLEGDARAGLITPLGIPAAVRNLRRGDLLVQPQGWVLWIWNNGQERVRVLHAADTSRSTSRPGGAKRAEQTSFSLIGGQEEEGKQERGAGGLLHGFSSGLLARAWDVDEQDVQQLLDGQKETGIVKVEQREAEQLEADLDRLEAHTAHNGGAFYFGDFVYNLEERARDFEREGAGWSASINGFKSRVLRHVGFAASRLRLEANAQVAPHWQGNSAVMYYAIKGSAYIEIVDNDGRPAVRRDINEGDAVVVPSGFAHSTIAKEQGFDGVGITLETSRPYRAFLAGGNSQFRALPRAIQRAAFNVDDQLLEKLRETRRDDYFIFPPAGGRKADGFASVAADERAEFLSLVDDEAVDVLQPMF